MLRNIISLFLILFVISSIGYLIYSETKGVKPVPVNSQESKTTPANNLDIAGSNDGDVPKSTATIPSSTEKVIVYYFHGTARCPTCLAIEQYAKEAVQKGFARELESGNVEFKSINVEQPENEHFIQDFQLTTRCVVVEWNVNGQRQDWKRLERVWELVHTDKEKYYDYIQENIRTYIKG